MPFVWKLNSVVQTRPKSPLKIPWPTSSWSICPSVSSTSIMEMWFQSENRDKGHECKKDMCLPAFGYLMALLQAAWLAAVLLSHFSWFPACGWELQKGLVPALPFSLHSLPGSQKSGFLLPLLCSEWDGWLMLTDHRFCVPIPALSARWFKSVCTADPLWSFGDSHKAFSYHSWKYRGNTSCFSKEF